MENKFIFVVPAVVLAFPALVCAAPWSTDLEEDMASLPWVITGDILAADSGGVMVVVTESFIGDNSPEDTLFLEYWGMGSWMSEVLSPSEGILLIPDSTGSLQITGTPGQGYWLLRGYFDFNAFWVSPGVISREELILLCSGDTLPERKVDAEIRFAGMSDFMPLSFQQAGGSWVTDSRLPCLSGIRLDSWKVRLGGTDAFPWEPDVEMVLPTEDGGLLVLSGRVTSFSQGVYSVEVYPTGPMISGIQELRDYVEGNALPSPPVIDVQVQGIDPVRLGLAEDPYMTTGESGRLHLRGIEGMLDITSFFHQDGYQARPIVGFDHPMTCSDPLYFDFRDLPPGPSGHLATDIMDALAKGYVSGELCRIPGEPVARFTLFMMR